MQYNVITLGTCSLMICYVSKKQKRDHWEISPRRDGQGDITVFLPEQWTEILGCLLLIWAIIWIPSWNNQYKARSHVRGQRINVAVARIVHVALPSASTFGDVSRVKRWEECFPSSFLINGLDPNFQILEAWIGRQVDGAGVFLYS